MRGWTYLVGPGGRLPTGGGLDEVGLAVGEARGAEAGAPVLGVVGGAGVDLDEVPAVLAVGLQGGLGQAGGGPFAAEVVPPGGDGDAVDVIAAEGGGDAVALGH